MAEFTGTAGQVFCPMPVLLKEQTPPQEMVWGRIQGWFLDVSFHGSLVEKHNAMPCWYHFGECTQGYTRIRRSQVGR